jgi:hypothetical protein
MSEPVARYRSIVADLAVGNVLKSGDAAWLHACMVDAVQSNISVERAMVQPRQWREAIRICNAIETLMAMFDMRPVEPQSEAIRLRLSKYESGTYRSNRARGIVPPGDNGVFHEFLLDYGKVPTSRCLAQWRRDFLKELKLQRKGPLACNEPPAS